MQESECLFRITAASDYQPRQMFFGLGKCNLGIENDTPSAYASMTARTRFPSTARTRMLASTISALLGIPLLFAASSADALVLLHQLLFAGAPGCDHFVEVFCRCAHRL